jgi:hypothetical protein
MKKAMCSVLAKTRNYTMQSAYKKIKSILRKNLRIKSSKADLHKNLVDDLGFCEWEVEYLIAKVENEFNVDLAYISTPRNITVGNLLLQVKQRR